MSGNISGKLPGIRQENEKSQQQKGKMLAKIPGKVPRTVPGTELAKLKE